MRIRLVTLLLGVVVAATACAGGSIATSGALVGIGAGLEGTAGWTATVYAGGLEHVSAMAVDAGGRLWVATADYTDSGTDGLYLVASAGSTPVEVVPGLHTPLGLLWFDDSLYLSSAAGVVAYSGFDGARFASRRTVVTLPTGVGEVNGLALGPDGRISLGISAPCDHCTTTMAEAGSVVSFLPDGSDLRVDATGIRAPVGLAFVPGTDDLLVTMDQRDDLGDATPGDWLSIVRPSQKWGFPGCYGQGGSACAGVPAPLAVLDRHAAVSGVAVVRSGSGARQTTSAFVAEWSLGTVRLVSIDGSGTAATGVAGRFLAGLESPVPIIADADGALYVGDWATGTVYRIARA